MTQPAASEIRVGTVLQDTYEIDSLLGKGGMGAVFLARHRRLPGRQVAVKVLQNSASLNPELYARFRREAEIASQLGHPNIVEVLDFDALPDGTPFLIMECLRGESLEQRLLRGRLPLEQTLAIVRQIGSALQAAHRAGVVHRDLKPANVFLVPTDSGGVVGERVKLLDFGISKMLDSQTLQTQESVLMGTPQYMSPEQALGKNREIDARTDLFALGCIVYEMLSGTPPFAGDGGSIVQVVFRIVHAQPEPLANLCPDLPTRVLGAVERALSKSPDERQPDVATFIEELTGSPLQSLSGAAVPSFSSSRAGSVPAPADDAGFAATHMSSSTARFPAPAPAVAAADDVGMAATHMPSSTARFPAPAAAAVDEAALGATLVPSSTVISQQRPVPAAVAVAAESSPVSPAPAPVVAAPPPVALARPAAKMGRMVGAGVLLLGCVAAGWWFASHSAPTRTEPVATAPSTPVPAQPPAPAPVDVKAPAAPEPTPQPTPVPSATHTPEAPAIVGKPASHQPSREVESETLPVEVRSIINDGEAALSLGKSVEAIELGESSLRIHPSRAGYFLITRAYCSQGALEQAKSRWREGQKLMSLTERNRVLHFCNEHDIELNKK